MQHQSVLLEEVIAGLAIKPSGRYIDATFGRGGHSAAILAHLGPDGRLLALDRDPEAIESALKGPNRDPRFQIVKTSFAQLWEVTRKLEWAGKVDGILLDLGVSSPQLDEAARGFSFLHEGPLDMRMDPTSGMSAAAWLSQATEGDIATVLWRYGEERQARRIARAIVNDRVETPFETTTQLAELIARVVRKSQPGKHPATRAFQAIRIFINEELQQLHSVLSQVLDVLTVGGRLCVISFHSLEDRIVKQFIDQQARSGELPKEIPIKAQDIVHRMKKVGRLIRPTAAEVANNARARSARLRIAEKLS